MRRGSTPVVTLTVDGQNFDGCRVVVTIDQNGTQVTKKNGTNDVDITKNYDEDGNFVSSTIAVYLSQSDTLAFDVGQARVQLRWINVLGEAEVSDIGAVTFDEVLLERVIEYGE